jgi:acyl-CoA synthetase (AMP-forming)/AMP-acid ligase II
VSWKDVELYRKHCSEDCVLSIELSCSEANTLAQFLVSKQTKIKFTVSVGYPPKDKEILILNEKSFELGPGEIGEIAVRSRFLSPGDWNRPDLTDLAFISEQELGATRIYRTGDLGRKSFDGCLEHFGRKDAQVKIRGYRVECREIELALLHNAAVDQVFVTHRQDPRDATYLVAYIVGQKGATLTVRELRADLVARLPEYMVPSIFVFLDALPLTPTGKIDRRALPEPSSVRSSLHVPLVTPRDPIEQPVRFRWKLLIRNANRGASHEDVPRRCAIATLL